MSGNRKEGRLSALQHHPLHHFDISTTPYCHCQCCAYTFTSAFSAVPALTRLFYVPLSGSPALSLFCVHLCISLYRFLTPPFSLLLSFLFHCPLSQSFLTIFLSLLSLSLSLDGFPCSLVAAKKEGSEPVNTPPRYTIIDYSSSQSSTVHIRALVLTQSQSISLSSSHLPLSLLTLTPPSFIFSLFLPLPYSPLTALSISPGTENVALIAGLGAASKLAREEADELLVHMLALKLRLILRLHNKLACVKVLYYQCLVMIVFDTD
jgi:hypothetical protein